MPIFYQLWLSTYWGLGYNPNCSRDCLLLTYLGVPLSGRQPGRQDWMKLTFQFALISRLGKPIISLKGRLTLINYVLTSIPIYWMLVFQLPIWVVKEIDKLRRDFPWKGSELGPKGFHLIAWKRVSRSRDMRYLGILNLHEFNKVLLGKWWWKIYSGQKSY